MNKLTNIFNEALSGKKVLVSGGSTGIGREITFLLTSLGADCVICGRDQSPIDEVVTQVKSSGHAGKCFGVAADLSKEEDIKKIFDEVDQTFGKLDILINNAALGYGGVNEGGYQDWLYIVKTNLVAYLALSNEATTRMKDAGKGHIVNIGSMSADVREENSSVYVATKSGIQGFSEALRKEVNRMGIKVTLIEPGAVDTDMQEKPKEEKLKMIENLEMLMSEDIALAVLFCLAQPERSDVVSLQIRPHMQLI